MSEESKMKGTLPYGWVVKTSKKYPDRVYYFNVTTGASTWECPQLDYPKVTENKEDVVSKCIDKLRKSTQSDPLTNDHGFEIISLSNKKHSRTSSEKLSGDETNRKSGSRKRSLEAETPPTPVDKCSVPPTAIVTPVILDRNASGSDTPLQSKRDKISFGFRKPTKRLQKTSPITSKLTSSVPAANPGIIKTSSIPATNPGIIKTSSVPATSPGIIKPDLSDEHRPPGTSVMRSKFSKSTKVVKSQNETDKPSTSFLSTSETESSDTDLSMHSEVDEPTTASFIRPTDTSTTSQGENEENSAEDIEMLDVSADLTKIDDLAAEAQRNNNFCSYYIVVDTNVLIEDLHHIDEIKDTPVEGCGPPHIFIPWIVIQELDALKQSTKGSVAARGAQNAVKYLNSVLKSKHPRFHGQSPQEAEDIAKTYSSCNDDRILECCMNLQEKMPQEKVILLTNDKNLVNKALICDIVVHDWESMMKVLKPDVIIKAPVKKKKKKVNKNGIVEDMSDTAQINLEKKLVQQRDICKSEIHALMSEARQLLKDTLLPLFKQEMDEAYGDCWHAFNLQIDVLKDLLNAYDRFWRTVFCFHFPERDRRCFDLLREKANRPEGFLGDKKECSYILTAIEDIFRSTKKKWPDLEVPIEKIKDLKTLCNETFDKHDSIDQSISHVECVISESETDSVLKAFENNWTAINHLCGMVMDFYQLPHNFVYEKPSSVPSEIEFRRLMVNLYPSVEQLMQLMQEVVKLIEGQNPTSKGIFKKLYKALNELIPTLQIQAENPHLPHFSAKALERFCCDPKNAERVKFGCKQIENFFSNLDTALHVMSTPKRENRPVAVISEIN